MLVNKCKKTINNGEDFTFIVFKSKFKDFM